MPTENKKPDGLSDGSAKVKQWFDAIEEVLTAEGRVAGASTHGSTIGTAREYFVTRVLKMFLPPAAHIGSGQVLSSCGAMSRQIDVIVYDPRFPMLQVGPGSAIYLQEGVIAAIEVKSVLTVNTLRESLINCASVFNADFKVWDYGNDAIDRAMRIHECERPHAQGMVCHHMAPRSFVFAFTSALKPETAANTVVEHMRTLENFDPKWDPRLPRVVVGGDLVALSCDDYMTFPIDERDAEGMRSEFNGEPHSIACLWKTSQRFGIFASALIRAVLQRLGTQEHRYGLRFAPEDYMPLKHYAEEMGSHRRVFIYLCHNQVSGRSRFVLGELGPTTAVSEAADGTGGLPDSVVR